ncbi:MAG TPA: ABC transporter substrate-binding protein [Acidimicrobiales bacterium]|nr:ABC transporter substrate-binding protein [Acidimicrobiales bacterium]
MRRRRQAIASLAVVALMAGACTRAEGETEIGAAATGSGDQAQTADGGGAGGTSGSRLDQGTFGDLDNLCADGEPGTVTETGLTADEIHLGTVTDRGSAERPGLTQEMYDSAVAFAAWCNEHGGIGGRQIVIDDLDAKLFEYGQRVGEACQRDFALVGGGAVFDAQDNGARVACGLPNLPGYAVTPQARVAELQVQPVPNPVYSFASAGYRWLQGRFPEADKLGILWVNLDGPATIHDQIAEMAETLGFEIVFDEQYRPLGETGWRGFVQKMREEGVTAFEMIGEPENMVALQQAMQIEGWYPEFIHLQPNYYDKKFQEEGAGSVSEATYMRSPFPTFEMADEVPAMADYLELMERYNPEGKTAMLGMQGLSAFLLFATAANECGADLSRACLLEKAAAQDGWTAGGLHSPQTPGNLVATQCSLAIQVTAQGFVYDEELTEPNEGIYNCDPGNVVELTDDYGVPRPAA